MRQVGWGDAKQRRQRHRADLRGAGVGGLHFARNRSLYIVLMDDIRRINALRETARGKLAAALQHGDSLIRQRKSRLIGLPCEIGVGNGAGQHQRGRAAFRFRGVCFVDGRFDRRARLAPEIEIVLERKAQIALVVPGEPEKLRRDQTVLAEPLALHLCIGRH